VTRLQLKQTKLKLEVLKFDFQPKKERYMNTGKLAIKWQNFAQIRLQLKFTFKLQASVSFSSFALRLSYYLFY